MVYTWSIPVNSTNPVMVLSVEQTVMKSNNCVSTGIHQIIKKINSKISKKRNHNE